MTRGTIRPMAAGAKKTLEMRAAIHNRFDVEVIDAFTGEIRQRARGFNIICETLWDRLFHINSQEKWTPQDYFNYVLYGSGSGTPATSDTELFELVGSKSTSNLLTMNSSVATGVIYRQAIVTLQAEDAVDETLTEVGIGYDQTHIVTHALLEDMNGNPISIEKTDTDVIKIYATVYVHFPAGGWYGGSVTVAENQDENGFFGILTGKHGTSAVQFARLGAGTRTGTGNGGYTSGASRSDVVVTDGSHLLTWTNRLAAAELNLPIRSIPVASSYSSGSMIERLCFWLTPGAWAHVPDVESEPVGTGNGSSVGFATVFPVKEGIAVYVDGVEAENVTFRPGPADAAHMEYWLNACYRTDDGTPAYYTNSYTVGNTSSGNFTGIRRDDAAPGFVSAALENPFSAVGIGKIRGVGLTVGSSSRTVGRIDVSNDMLTWESAGTFELGTASAPGELTIPQAMRTKKYWRFANAGQYTNHILFQFVADVADTANNIVFSSPPAAGAVITADYSPDCIPKDENHVFDVTLQLVLNLYAEV